MKPAFFIVVLMLLLPIGLQAKDNSVKNAQIDIARFEQQANGLTSARRSNVRRILKLLNLSYARLQQSPHQGDPDWQQVNQRFQVLQLQLEGLLANSGVTQKSSNGSKQVSSSAQSKTQQAAAKPLISGQRVRVKKLARDIESTNASIVTTGASSLQDSKQLADYKKRMKQFATALARYPQLDDPDVQKARSAYRALRKKLSDEFKRAQQQLVKLGNVQQRLANMDANGKKYRIPKTLSIPFSKEEAQSWVKQVGSTRTVAEFILKELPDIGAMAYLPNNPGTPEAGAAYDANDVLRLKNNAQLTLNKVGNAYQTLSGSLESRLTQIENNVLTRFMEDPGGDKKWVFIGEGKAEQAVKTFDESMAIARSAYYLEKAVGRKAEHASSVIEKIKGAKNSFIKRRDIALRKSRMPEPKSTDTTRLKIAREILDKPKYKFGKYGRIVLTSSDIVERERKDSEFKIDDAEITLGGDLKMKGTETIWTYKWKEFKFAVPLKEANSDNWRIWWITAKNFSSGGPRTPLNEWISGKATKGNLILKKNW